MSVFRLGVVLRRKTARDVITLAVRSVPREMCGLLLAPQGSNYCTEFRAIENVHEDPERYYRMNPDAMTRIWEYAQLNGMDVAGIVHSHPHNSAYPSTTDIRLAAYQDIPYLIVSIQPRVLKAFFLNDAYREIKVSVEMDKPGLEYCWACMRYEDTSQAFQVCYECGHVYRTEEDLIDAHNKVLQELDRYDRENNPTGYPPMDWEALFTGEGDNAVIVRRTPAELGDKVWSCPVCSHDF